MIKNLMLLTTYVTIIALLDFTWEEFKQNVWFLELFCYSQQLTGLVIDSFTLLFNCFYLGIIKMI